MRVNPLDGKERVGCFILIFFLMSCDCWCSVAIPRRVVGWYVVCACGISLSYSLAFLMKSSLTLRPLAPSTLAQIVIVFSYGCLRVIYNFICLITEFECDLIVPVCDLIL